MIRCVTLSDIIYWYCVSRKTAKNIKQRHRYSPQPERALGATRRRSAIIVSGTNLSPVHSFIFTSHVFLGQSTLRRKYSELSQKKSKPLLVFKSDFIFLLHIG